MLFTTLPVSTCKMHSRYTFTHSCLIFLLNMVFQSLWIRRNCKLPSGKIAHSPSSCAKHFTDFNIVMTHRLQWRASAIAQSGFKLEGSNKFVRWYKAVVQPPYRGVVATMLGMTWARAAIFYGSDLGKDYLKHNGLPTVAAQTLPPLVIGTFVQFANMPLVRSTITIQNPSSTLNSVSEALVHIYKTKGIGGLWHGVSAGILKTVPKYITAVAVKDYMEDKLPLVDPSDRNATLMRSAIKSITAGVAGAVLTNPLDVLRNE